MTVLGTLEQIRPNDDAAAKVCPVAPAHAAPAMSTTRGQSVKTHVSVGERILNDAERSREYALRRVELVRSSTTLAALAQTHAALDEAEAALAAAREAIDLSVSSSVNGLAWTDSPSANIAAEILLRFGDIKYAYEALRRAPITESLCVTFASIATEFDRPTEAEEALAPYEGASVASFRGYLRASVGDFQEAAHYLRQAVSEDPSDASALLNLSISLWNLGSTRKATRAALRATRSAPRRKDAALLYLDLLLAGEDLDGVATEIELLKSRRVVFDAIFMEVQARAFLLKGDVVRAVSLLTQAADKAKSEGDQRTEGRTRSNVVRFKYSLGRLDRDETSRQLADLLSEFPDNEATVVNFAAMARKRHDASLLRVAFPQVASNLTPIQRAFLEHRMAALEGNNEAAGVAAEEWFSLEPQNPMAATAALVAVGIGQSRWADAAVIAEYSLKRFPDDNGVVNNAAYVLAMSGRAEEAIRVLEPIVKSKNESVENKYVFRATLGLAYLAYGDIERGMRLYREAADEAELEDPPSRSLMTVYQALVVRQLEMEKAAPAKMIEATALVPVGLPDDWLELPEYLRLRAVCAEKGYDWPPSL